MQPYIRKVQYYETDAMGVVHHSNYIRWFEECRTDFMERAGFAYAEMEAAGVISPVLSAGAEYKRSVRYGETVSITATIESLTGARMAVVYEVVEATTGELRATGRTTHCFLNAEGRPVSLKKAQPEAYELYSGLVGK